MLAKQTAKPTEPVTLKKIGDIYCQISPNMQPRAYIPKPLRDTMLHVLHDVAHPGVWATLRLVQDWYFWPNMRRDVINWTRKCIQYQTVKITRHNKAPVVLLPPSTWNSTTSMWTWWVLFLRSRVISTFSLVSTGSAAGPSPNPWRTPVSLPLLTHLLSVGCKTMVYLELSQQTEAPTLSPHSLMTSWNVLP